MPVLFRPVVTALSVACLLSAASLSSTSAAFGQAKAQPAPSQTQSPAFKQIVLTDEQVEHVVAAQKEVDAIIDRLTDTANPDRETISQLDTVARKHGFADLEDYNNVVGNVSLVFGGIHPLTKEYIGYKAFTKARIAQTKGLNMSEKDKKKALDELYEELKSPEPVIENTANIDLVRKYYDRLLNSSGDRAH